MLDAIDVNDHRVLRRHTVPAAVRTPVIPEYVVHRDGVSQVGKLSAEAVVLEYESAAREVEAMGAHLIERVKQCEAMTKDALCAIDEMRETANRYREEGKRVFMQIEDCALITAEVRATCEAMKSKITR